MVVAKNWQHFRDTVDMVLFDGFVSVTNDGGKMKWIQRKLKKFKEWWDK